MKKHTVNVRRKPRPWLAVGLANAVSIGTCERGLEIYAVKLCLPIRMIELVEPRAGLEDVGVSARFDLRLRPTGEKHQCLKPVHT